MRKGNIDQVALKLGLSQRRIHELVAEGVFDRPVNGIHEIGKCVVAYLAYCIVRDKEFLLAYEAAKLQEDADAGRPMRFSIALGAREFGIPERVLRSRLERAGIQPSFPPTRFDTDDFASWALKNLHLLKPPR
jgi:hypothetical protein